MSSTAPTSCVFCKIANGQIPAHVLYADDRVLSFLDIGPLSEGHTLVIPKAHYETIEEMPEAVAASCVGVVVRMSRAVRAATGVDGWNVLQNNGRVSGQAVDHVHFHIIPRRPGDGLGYRWPAGQLDDTMAERLKAAIRSRLES